MKVSTAITSGAVLVLAAACTPPHPHAHVPRAIASLNCPRSEGDLTRTAQAPDGKSCLYASDNGEVNLRLIALNGGDAGAALDPIEASLRSEIVGGAAARGASAEASAGSTASTIAADKDRVDIDLPGIHIHANGNDKGKANVNVGGVNVDADGADSGHVSVRGGLNGSGVNVQADDNGAVVHVTEPGAGIRRTVILTSDTPGPNGYRAVGYEARGPLSGPIVVAVFKTRSDSREDLRDDTRALIRDNVGG